MTRNINFLFATFLLFSLSGCQTGDFTALEEGFVAPPTDVRTGVYWYWINDNISKEGVIKDLQAMKQAGIDRAYIGHIGEENRYPYGKIKMFTDEWWEVLHTALKTAGELDIEIGLFNSPGWSQSGGPWIKPEQSMRYLASSEVRVKGPQTISLKLEQPTEDFQDVKTLALPVPQGYRDNLFETPGAKITNKAMNLEADTCIGLILPQNAVARSLLIYPKGPFRADCEFQVKEGNGFRTIESFPAHRDNLDVCIGFEPLAPVVISFPDVEAKEFRIVFHKINKGSAIQSVQLTSTYTMERFPEKTLAKM
ncbi:MAG: glycoside hydrolase family 2, partial [Bacteroidales bacterium]|nr:glycoside hydrolase family 2 [Bacteroidales bacterium]